MQLVTSRAPRQGWLDLGGPAEHFQLIHGGHSSNVALCTLTSRATSSRGDWTERLYSRAEAAAIVPQLAANSDINVYQSQHGFHKNRRIASNVAALTSSFVDLDHYKIHELVGLDAEALLDRVLSAYPWLPVPTLIFDSGRGAYFSWLYPSPLGGDQLCKWQALEDLLVELLAPFGADPQARDAARVLRVVGSVNQKSGELVSGSRDSGPAISFDRLFACVTKHRLAERERESPALILASSTSAEPDAAPMKQTSTAAQRKQFIRPYELAHARMTDCRTLAALRGSPLMTDYRSRLLYVYAVATSWYTTSEEQLRAELEVFVANHYEDPDRYSSSRVGSVVDRLRHDRQGIARLWNGRRVANRYKLRNNSIIRLLEISRDEQRQLRTIIGAEEQHRRRVQRRRDKGMVERGVYLAEAAEKRARAAELRASGLTHSEIADKLGVTRGHVHYLLQPRAKTA